MSIFSKLREAAEQSAATNVDVYRQLASRHGMSMKARTEVAGAGVGIGGLIGVMGSALAVQSATLGTGGSVLAALGQSVIAAGTIAGGVYVVPAVALGAAALGAVGLAASKFMNEEQGRARELAGENPGGKRVTATDWARGLKSMVSRSIREAFAPHAEKLAGRFFDAIKDGNAAGVAKMLQKNPELLRCASKTGASPLGVALARQKTSVAEALFRAGASLEDRAHRDRSFGMRQVATGAGGASYCTLIEALAAHHAAQPAPSDALRPPGLGGALFGKPAAHRSVEPAPQVLRQPSARRYEP
jgi:hypothetical protein